MKENGRKNVMYYKTKMRKTEKFINVIIIIDKKKSKNIDKF